jgi:hypothetical protein
MARELSADPSVRELLDGEPAPDFGAAWADNLVMRVHDQTTKLTSLVAREGLRFAPSTPLAQMLDWLEEAEHQIADVRAAVQERLRDQQVQVS